MTATLNLLWNAVWAENPLVGKVVILVILALLARSLHVGRRLLSRYRRERVELRRVAHMLNEWRREQLSSERGESPTGEEEATANNAPAETEESTDATAANVEDHSTTDVEKENPAEGPRYQHPGLIDLDRLREGIRPTSLIGDRIQAIGKMRSYRVRVDIKTLQQLSTRRDESTPGHGFPSFAAGQAMMLGILGTFVGLAAMVQEIHLGLPQAIEAIDLTVWGDSLENLRSVLGGMKTAFSTSLVGMATAIIASFTAYRIRRRRQEVFEELERLTSEELLPATVPAVEDELLLERVSMQLEESFHQLDEISRQNRETLKDLSTAEEVFVDIVDDVRSITRAQAARNLDSLIERLGKTNEAVLRVAEHIPRIATTMQDTGQRIERVVREMSWSTPSTGISGDRLLGLKPATWLWVLVALVLGFGLLPRVLG